MEGWQPSDSGVQRQDLNNNSETVFRAQGDITHCDFFIHPPPGIEKVKGLSSVSVADQGAFGFYSRTQSLSLSEMV